MTDRNWQNVKELFIAVLEKDPAERTEFLKNVCNGDGITYAEVESLLASHSAAEDFIETPAFQVKEVFDDNSGRIHQRFGAYTIKQEIGVGGMGAVFLARRDDGEFDQLVALKIVRQSIAESHVIERFKNERQILATLNHPNIAKLLDGGVSETGEPFIAMEYVDGDIITQFADAKNLGLRARIELFLKVCSAVAYAHRNLVVHRDLKPNNIMVTNDGEPKLLDFGLAKLLDESIPHDADQTQTVFRALTPAYASPEQLRGGPISTSSDVYSLGVVLYELLTGARPFDFEGKSLERVIATVSESEPLPPSSNPNSKIRNPRLKGDLDNIILTALRSEPARRYISVEAFAGDIEKHLAGLPVSARPNTFNYRTGKFISRHSIVVAAASFVLLAVLGGLAATLWQARIAARERDQALQEQARSEQINGFLQSILSAASPDEKGKDAKVVDVLDDAVQKIDTQFADDPSVKAQALLTVGQTYNKLGLMDEAEGALRRALTLNSELYGVDNKATITCMIYLGATVLNQAKYDEAEQLLSQAIGSGRKLSPNGSKDIALALDGLGELYVRKGELEKAKPLLNESVAMSEALLGEINAGSALALVSLARAQAFSGEQDAAEDTYRRSIAIYRQLPPRDAVGLATALLNFGSLLVTKGSYDEGISTMREAEQIFFQKQGESFTTFETKIYLCKAFYSQQDYTNALAEGSKALEIGRRLKLENAADFVMTMRVVGLALTRTGKAKEGEPTLRDSLDRSRSSQPSAVPYAEGALGECLTEQKRFAEAEPLLKSSFEGLSKTLSPDSPLIKPAWKRLFDLYTKWKKPDLAEKYAR
ncbi:MAG: serine/threonine-protein kinase [Acidobacteriota bacterium]